MGTFVTPATDYAQFPKANIILITHEHKDHYDLEAITTLRNKATSIFVNNAVFNMFKNGIVMRNGDSIQYAPDIKIEAVISGHSRHRLRAGGYFKVHAG